MKTFFSVFFAILKGFFKGLFWIIRFLLHLPDAKSKLYDSSFMKASDKRKLLSTKHTGICVNGRDKISPEHSKLHSLIIGKTGVGKTSVFTIPGVLNHDNKTMIISDMDGEIYRKTSGYLSSVGYNIITFDLLNTESSHFYNPISQCYTNDDLKTLATQIIDAGSGNSQEKFWDNSATNLLFFLFKLVKTQPEHLQNLSNVRQLLLLLEIEGFDEFVSESADNELWLEYLSIKAQDSKLRSNISATLSSILDLLSYDEISYITSKNTLDFNALVTNQMTVMYIIVPEYKISKYSLLVSTLYNQLFSYLMKHRPPHTVYAFLDEMSQYRISEIQMLLTTIRRYGISLNCLIQEYQQLVSTYDESIAMTLFSNASSKVIFTGSSLQLAEMLSRMSGTETVVENNESEVLGHKPLLTPREIIQLPAHQCLFFHSNLAPSKLRLYPYYKNPTLLSRSKKSPFVRETHTYQKPPLISLSDRPTPNPNNYDGFDAQTLS